MALGLIRRITLAEVLEVIDEDIRRAVSRIHQIKDGEHGSLEQLYGCVDALQYLRDKLVGVSKGKTFRHVRIGEMFGWVHGVTIYRKTAQSRAKCLSDGGYPEREVEDLDAPIR